MQRLSWAQVHIACVYAVCIVARGRAGAQNEPKSTSLEYMHSSELNFVAYGVHCISSIYYAYRVYRVYGVCGVYSIYGIDSIYGVYSVYCVDSG